MTIKMTSEQQHSLTADFLLDILAWQSVLVDLKAGELSEKTGKPLKTVMKDMEAAKKRARSALIDGIYEKYGETPDEIKDALNEQPDEEP